MSVLDRLDPRYATILCDIWGCVHDGAALYPGAARRLRQWRDEKRFVILITNAPRTVEAVVAQLHRLGLDDGAWDALCSSGEAGIAAVKRLGEPVGFLGTAEDRTVVEAKGVAIAVDETFAHVAVTGLDEYRPAAGQYRAELERWANRGVVMHCLNPDRVVIHRGETMVCAGALADIYEALGGQVLWYGKPHRPIYDHAFGLAGNPPLDTVLAVGDGLQTDVLGAARMGIDCVFVTGGIHGGEPFPADFAERYGLGGWAPLALVEGIG